MLLGIGAASALGLLLWGVVLVAVLARERRRITRVSRALSAMALMGVDAVLVMAYVLRVDTQLVLYAAALVQSFKIVASLAALVALRLEGRRGQRSSDDPRRRTISRRWFRH